MFTLISLFAHLGQALQSAGSMFKDMLMLRIFLVAGIGFEMVYQFNKADEPLTELIIWSVIFMLINIIQIIILINERMKNKLSEKEARLYEIVFSSMAKYNFKKLISNAYWKQAVRNDIIVNEGSVLPELIVIYKGLAEVRANGKAVAMLRDGQFCGEMSFLTGKLTTAEVVSVTDLEYACWNKKELDTIMSKFPDISSDLQKIFNTDLIKKLVKQNS